jgi:hypothetical protein
MDVTLVLPHISSMLSSGTNLDAAFPGNPVQMPVAGLSITGAPRIELGYRFGQGLGEFRTTYRYLSTTGQTTIPGVTPAGDQQLKSNLTINVVNFDYAFTEFNPGDLPFVPSFLLVPGYLGLRREPAVYQDSPLSMRWLVGISAANVYFDSTSTGTTIVQQRAMNNFSGVGLHTGIEMTKALPWRPLSLYGRFDFTGLYGDTNQAFDRTTNTGVITSSSAWIGPFHNGAAIFGAELGASYVPDWGRQRLRLTTGYVYEQWWYLAETPDSTADIKLNGIMFRGQWGF